MLARVRAELIVLRPARVPATADDKATRTSDGRANRGAEPDQSRIPKPLSK
jgi:hypothetical protein